MKQSKKKDALKKTTKKVSPKKSTSKTKTIKKTTPKKTSLKKKVKKQNPIIAYLLGNKKFVLFVVISILLITVSTSYAYYMFTVAQEGSNIVAADCFKIRFTESNDINLRDTMPVSESYANNLIPYTLTIKNICKQAQSYDLTIEELNSSTLSLNYVRIKVDNDTSQLLGSISPNLSTTLTNARSSRTLKSGILIPNLSL